MTLHIQDYLRSGKTPTDLQEELGIRHAFDGSLCLFKYDQIESPRNHPVVKECRGLVLENNTWKVVAKPFDRFFNVGEFEDELAKFDWNNFTSTEKVDGSLIIVYNYQGQWRINTSGSFATGQVDGFGGSWNDLFHETLAPDLYYADSQGRTKGQFIQDWMDLPEDHTFMFELCTPYNKIVRRYAQPIVYLLGATRHTGSGYISLPEQEVDEIYQRTMSRAPNLRLKRPQRYSLLDREDVHKFLLSMAEQDPTFEGVILRDNSTRWKWKTATYAALHHLKDNGNILSPKRLVPLVLAGEVDEVSAYLPEVTTALFTVKDLVDQAREELIQLWRQHAGLTIQKDFAMAVKDHKLASMLFANRKQKGDERSLLQIFREGGDQIVKSLFGDRTFQFDELDVNGHIIKR